MVLDGGLASEREDRVERLEERTENYETEQDEEKEKENKVEREKLANGRGEKSSPRRGVAGSVVVDRVGFFPFVAVR